MKTCQTRDEFKQRLDVASPRFVDTMRLRLSSIELRECICRGYGEAGILIRILKA
jgi:hypothetical protein